MFPGSFFIFFSDTHEEKYSLTRIFKLLGSVTVLLAASFATQADGTYFTLTPVIVYGTHIEDIGGAIFTPSFDTVIPYTVQIYASAPNPAMYVVGILASRLPDLCKNTFITDADLRKTTSKSDVMTRWLAAQAAFVTVQQYGLFSLLQQLGGRNGMAIIMNRVKYNGWRIIYSNGVQEVWAINPAASTSSVKLLDQPMPDSQKKVSAGCNNIS